MERSPHDSPERNPDRKVVEPRGGWTWWQRLPDCGGHEKGQETNERATERPDTRDTAFATGKGRRHV